MNKKRVLQRFQSGESSNSRQLMVAGGRIACQARRVRLPEGCDVAVLKGDSEKIAADLLVDVSLAEFIGS